MNMIAIIPAAIIIPLAGWKMYSRYRNSVGRQQLTPRTSWASVVLFPLLFVCLGALSFRDFVPFASLLAGGAVGVCLGISGLRLTTFEASGSDVFYRPNPYLGSTLLLLLAARITYRFLGILSHGLPAEPDDTGSTSPFGLAIIGAVIWYYAVYSAGLLHRRSQFQSR
jgi:hypothetical protein